MTDSTRLPLTGFGIILTIFAKLGASIRNPNTFLPVFFIFVDTTAPLVL
jgi:hypothetical protein